MSRNMFTLCYDNIASVILFKILKKNKKVKYLDWIDIEKDKTNERTGQLFFIEGPTTFVNVMCALSGKVISNRVCTYVKTKDTKIIGEE